MPRGGKQLSGDKEKAPPEGSLSSVTSFSKRGTTILGFVTPFAFVTPEKLAIKFFCAQGLMPRNVLRNQE